MFLAVVEVGIGMVFIWLVLALASMSVQEWLAGFLKFRARDLENQIRNMLNDPSPKWLDQNRWLNRTLKTLVDRLRNRFRVKVGAPQVPVFKIADEVLKHPLIKALSKSGHKPSYIPDRTFALALFDVVVTAGTDDSLIRKNLSAWEKKLQPDKLSAAAMAALELETLKLIEVAEEATGKPEFRSKVNTEITRIVSQLTGKHPDLAPYLDDFYAVMPDAMHVGADLLQNGIQKIWADNPQIAQAMSTLLSGVTRKVEANVAGGEEALAGFRTNVETWFNDSMARLSGWYKRRAQTIGLVIGLILAIVFNVDSVNIARFLWREPVAREALANQAAAFEMPETTEGAEGANVKKAWDNFYTQFDGMGLPLGWEACTTRPDVQYRFKDLALTLNEQCYIPVDAPEQASTNWAFFGIKLFGWLVSGVAAAQGAQYWFDILKMLVNIRSSGRNPDEEKGKAKK
jgi:hypothetical protein